MRTLGRGYIPVPATFKSTGTYHYTIVARKFIQAGRVGLTLVVRTTLFIGTVEDTEVVVIGVIAGKDIGDEFQDRRLSNAGLSKQKDGVRRLPLVFCCLDDTLFEGRYVAKESGQYYRIKDVLVAYLIVWVSSSLSFSSMALVELQLEGSSSLDRPPTSVITLGPESYGKPHSLGLVPSVGIGRV